MLTLPRRQYRVYKTFQSGRSSARIRQVGLTASESGVSAASDKNRAAGGSAEIGGASEVVTDLLTHAGMDVVLAEETGDHRGDSSGRCAERDSALPARGGP
jgi:hypothetical protein